MKLLLTLAAALVLLTPATQVCAQTLAPVKTAVPAAAMPSSQEIADAKAKGMVWVNTKTKVYHKDGQFYGNTKHGKFMAEDDATKAGYRAAKMESGKKTTPPVAAK